MVVIGRGCLALLLTAMLGEAQTWQEIGAPTNLKGSWYDEERQRLVLVDGPGQVYEDSGAAWLHVPTLSPLPEIDHTWAFCRDPVRRKTVALTSRNRLAVFAWDGLCNRAHG